MKEDNNNSNNTEDNKTEFEILLENHPELEDKMLEYINGKDFYELYKEYFWNPVNNCIKECNRNMDNTYVFKVTSALLQKLGFNDFRNYAEYMVLHNVFYNSKQKALDKGADLSELLDGIFTKALPTKEFKDYIITVLSGLAKCIGMGYVNKLVDFLQNQPTENYEYDPDDDYYIS